MDLAAVADYLLTHRRVIAQYRPGPGAIPQRHAALEKDQVVGRPVLAALDPQYMAGLTGAGTADRGEHVQLWILNDLNRFAGGLLQLRQGLVGGCQEFATATSSGLWHRWPRIPVQAGAQ